MKRLISGLLLGGILLSSAAQAIIIEASYSSFISRTSTIAGVGSGGGYGKFTVTSAPAATGDPLLDNLFSGEFLAYCLEPDETVSRNVTYSFELVDLASAPTSPSSGPMGTKGRDWIERIIAATNYGTVDELVAGATTAREYTFQMALYEAGYETKTAAAMFAFDAGDTVISSVGSTAVDNAVHVTRANNVALDTSGVNTYALLNLGRTDARTTNVGQDFFLFTRTVPEPAPLALIGLSLLGLGLTRKL